jgi:hypothetical protein
MWSNVLAGQSLSDSSNLSADYLGYGHEWNLDVGSIGLSLKMMK